MARHSGLELLREAIGAAVPQWARKGALTPKHLAPLAGVNYSTVRQLLNGARRFESDTPLNRLMAENLSFTTGVHPDFRTTSESFIRDVWGAKYTADTYLQWTKDSPVADALHYSSLGQKPGKQYGPFQGEKVDPLATRMKGQAEMLLAAIIDASKSKGPQYECMAFRLLKEAMTGVAEDLGVLEQVEKTPGLIDFVMGMDELFWRSMGALVVVIRDSPWKATNSALSLEARFDDKEAANFNKAMFPSSLTKKETEQRQEFFKALKSLMRKGEPGQKAIRPSIITVLPGDQPKNIRANRK